MKRIVLVLALTAFSAAARGGLLRGRVLVGAEPGWRVALLVDGETDSGGAPGHTRLDEQWLSFIPKVQVVAPGSTLRFENHDDHPHTVHGRLGATTLFHLATVPGRAGAPQEVTLSRLGVVTINCEMHESMHATVVVSRAAHHAVTDEDGNFVVEDLPPGRYRVRAVWEHGEAPRVDVEPGEEVARVEVGTVDATVELHLQSAPLPPEPAPAKVEPPRPLHAARARFFDGPAHSWPSGVWVYLASALALLLGLGAAAASLRLATARGWSKLAAVVIGCGLAFAAGVLFAFGLHGAVATALGFGLFVGTAVFAAGE